MRARNMTHKEAENLTNLTKQTMREDLNWSEEEMVYGIMHLSTLMSLIQYNQLPSSNPKFPELLRILANVYELLTEIEKQTNESLNERFNSPD
jgi:hypothetical protein